VTWLPSALVALSLTQAEPLVLRVVPPSCPEAWLPTEAVLERLRLEVVALGFTEVTLGTLEVETLATTVVLQGLKCGDSLGVRVVRPNLAALERRTVSLGVLSAMERARLLAFVIAEMLTPKADDRAPAPVAPKPPPPVPAAPVSSRNRLSTSFGAEAFPNNRSAPATVLVAVERDVSAWLTLSAGLRGRYGLASAAAGQVSTLAATARLAASFLASSNDVRLLVGGHAEAGWLRVAGQTVEFELQPQTRDAWAALAGVHARIEVVLSGQVSLFTALEVTMVIVGLEGRALGTPTGGLSSAGLSGAVGFSWRWAS
jgi:hypothetical protein